MKKRKSCFSAIFVFVFAMPIILNAQIYTPSGGVAGISGQNYVVSVGGAATNPYYTFIVLPTNNTYDAIMATKRSAYGYHSCIAFLPEGTFTSTTPQWAMGIKGSSYDFTVWTNPSSNPFTIKTNGNVGIGTTTPSTKLGVTGDIQLRALNSRLILGNGDNSNYGHL